MSDPGTAIQAALSKTRLVGEGQLKEIGAGYTFFWSGRNAKERRESGVGFAVKLDTSQRYQRHIDDTPTPLSQQATC